jgi:putative flippase GtrA
MLKLLAALHASRDGRYAIVFATTVIVEVGVFALIVGIPAWSTWAVLVATVASFLFNFFGHVHYTFKGHPSGPMARGIYFVLKVAILLMRNVLYGLLVTDAGLGAWASYGITFLVGVAGYVGAKRVIGKMTIREQLETLRDALIAVLLFLRVFLMR